MGNVLRLIEEVSLQPELCHKPSAPTYILFVSQFLLVLLSVRALYPGLILK